MQIEVATQADLLFIRDLQRKFTNQIGFIPTAATERELQRGNILHGSLNADDTGFLFIRPALSYQPEITAIIQAAVRMDAQRQAVGLALVERAAADALARGQTILQASCRRSLDANLFWEAAGFTAIATRPGGKANHDTIIIWRKALTQGANIETITNERYARGPGGHFTTHEKKTHPQRLP